MAALALFHIHPTLELYQRIKELAGENWSERRDECLRLVKEKGTPGDCVDVLLHEGLIDDAIEIAQRPDKTLTPEQLEKVAVAAIRIRPTWVLQISLVQVNRLIATSSTIHYAKVPA